MNTKLEKLTDIKPDEFNYENISPCGNFQYEVDDHFLHFKNGKVTSMIAIEDMILNSGDIYSTMVDDFRIGNGLFQDRATLVTYDRHSQFFTKLYNELKTYIELRDEENE